MPNEETLMELLMAARRMLDYPERGWKEQATGKLGRALSLYADEREAARVERAVLLRERDALIQQRDFEWKSRKEATEAQFRAEAERDEARRQRDALADMLVEVRRIIESPNAPWWMDSSDRGGFDLEAINAALAKAGRHE